MLTLSSGATAQSWTAFCRDIKGEKQYYQIRERTDKEVIAWWKYHAAFKSIVFKGKLSTVPDIDVLELYAVECKSGRYYLLQVAYQDTHGMSIPCDSLRYRIDRGQASRNSLDGLFLQAVCQ